MKFSKLISVAAVFAGLFAVQSAGAWGAVVRDMDEDAVGVSYNEPTPAAALAAAERACVDGAGNSVSSGCDVRITVFANRRVAAHALAYDHAGTPSTLVFSWVAPDEMMVSRGDAAMGLFDVCRNRLVASGLNFLLVRQVCVPVSSAQFNGMDGGTCSNGTANTEDGMEGCTCDAGYEAGADGFSCEQITPTNDAECVLVFGAGYVFDSAANMCKTAAADTDAECAAANPANIWDGVAGECRAAATDGECVRALGLGAVYNAAASGCVKPAGHADCAALPGGGLVYDSANELCRRPNTDTECARVFGASYTFNGANNRCETPDGTTGVAPLPAPGTGPAPAPTPTPPTPPASGGGGSGGGNNTGAYAAGIGVIVLMAAFANAGAAGGVFSYTPEYSFSSSNGVASYSLGSRLDYENGGFSAFWSAGRPRGGLDLGGWNLAGGMAYAGEIREIGYEIGYGSEIFGEETALEFSAAVSEESGILNMSSAVVADYWTDGAGGGFSASWRNSLEAEVGGWTVEPSADVYFAGGGGFAGFSGLRLNLRREF